ncbi:MAG: lysine--tRNA ligase [Bacteroidota bacterium]
MNTSDTLNKVERDRYDKIARLEELGINPYPSEPFKVDTTPEKIVATYEKEAPDNWQVSIAGRIMSRRVMGKTCFMSLQYEGKKIQLFVQRQTLCPSDDKILYDEVVKKLLDIGDLIGVQGVVFRTKAGEISIKVTHLTLLAKSIKPLPDIKEVNQAGEGIKRFNDFTDPEARYRQRYVDLIVNPHVREVFIKRAQIVKTIREYFDSKGYLEVETPILQPLYGGAAAKPFTTHHNRLNQKLFLRISNELYLKRLIVGDYKGVYEFSKDFRNEGMSRFHNPEFTQVEVYVAYQDYQWMMGEVEKIIHNVAQALHGTAKVAVGEHTIDFSTPWKRFTMYEIIKEYTGLDVSTMEEETLRKEITKRGITIDKGAGKGKLLDELFGATCEPHIIQPTFITDYPIETSPLAKKHRDDPNLVERFEVICNGKEILNAFSELNDPVDQRRRFEAQAQLAKRGDEEAMVLDEDFIRALSYGMPPTVGLGIGIDRLTMIMTNQSSIRDVLFFPQMRPEGGSV